MALETSYPGYHEGHVLSLTAGHGTQAQVLVADSPAVALPLAVGDGLQRYSYGGRRVLAEAALAVSTDGTARELLLYRGQLLTLPGRIASIGTGQINRADDGFFAEGWRPGDSLMLLGGAVAVNNGRPFTVQAVLDNQLAVAAGAFTADASPGSGACLLRVAQIGRLTVPAEAGNGGGPPVALFDLPAIPRAPDGGIMLGDSELLLVAPVAPISAAPARIDLSAASMRY